MEKNVGPTTVYIFFQNIFLIDFPTCSNILKLYIKETSEKFEKGKNYYM